MPESRTESPPGPDKVSESAPTAPPGVMASIETLWGEVRAIAYDQLQLVALEARRAALGLVTMVVEGIVVGMLVAAGWIATVAAFSLWLIEQGLETSAALLVAALLNLAGALGFALAIRRKSRLLSLPARAARLRQGSPPDKANGETDRIP